MHSLITTRGAWAALIAVGLAFAPTARAATFTVNNTSDPTVGTCDLAGACTLRQAIIEAVASAERDTIRFDPAVFPPGAPVAIYVESPLPTIADPAGTVIDGAGAGVRIWSQIPVGDDDAAGGLVFASAPGKPLANVKVANLMVFGFDGSGVVICGGLPPECDADVASPSVQHVVATLNTEAGIVMAGRTITNPRVADSVALANYGGGIVSFATESVSGARIERCAARDNEFVGLGVGLFAQSISDTLITDSVAVRNGYGIAIAAEEVAKTKLTNLAASDNVSSGIVFEAGEVSMTTLANATASGNGYAGIQMVAESIVGTFAKDVVANDNLLGIDLMAATEVVDARIVQATAVGNTQTGISLGAQARGSRLVRVNVVGNGTHGLVVSGTENVLEQVRASENDGDGIRLAAPGSGNRIENCSGTANQGPGISVQTGSTGNTIRRNVALGNDAIDVYDGNPNCADDAWTRNVFEMRSEPCIR
jgi:hypothetical protein